MYTPKCGEGCFLRSVLAEGRKAKSAILKLDELMLWHNIKQRHPLSVSLSHVISLHDKHIYMTFPHLADGLIQSDTRACPGCVLRKHFAARFKIEASVPRSEITSAI